MGQAQYPSSQPALLYVLTTDRILTSCPRRRALSCSRAKLLAHMALDRMESLSKTLDLLPLRGRYQEAIAVHLQDRILHSP